MPANLTPQYLKAEEAYRRATSPEEELECLQVMLRELPKHKGTDKLNAELKQKISKVRKDLQQGKAAGKRAGGLRIPQARRGTCDLDRRAQYGQESIARQPHPGHTRDRAYPFTTREPIPGMMPWEDVTVQLIDTPPITRDVLDPHARTDPRRRTRAAVGRPGER